MIFDLIKERKLFEKQALDEISYEMASDVEDWLASNGDKLALPFKDLFNQELRVVIPLGPAVQPGSQISDFVQFFESNGYKVDFSTGLGSKEITDREGNPRLKQQKLGKLLANALKYSKKIHTLEADIAGITSALGWEARREDPEWKKKSAERLETEDRARKVFPKITQYFVHRLETLIDFWNKKSQFYRENPDKAFIDYSIILSRAPIDVLRMSDHKNITSCHSEGSDYFKCARAEARGHGPVAYAVETRDLEQIDLDDEEIFEDRERRISGIKPVARIRLRKFTNQDTSVNFAVPEKRTYGSSIPGFDKKLIDWALENQKGVWEDHVDPNSGKISPDFMKQFIRTGGSYEDTSSSTLFNKMFKKYDANFVGSVRHQGQGEEELDPEQDEYMQYQQMVEEFEEAGADAEYEMSRTHDEFNISYEVMHEDEYEAPYIYFSGGMRFQYTTGEEELPEWRDLLSIADEISSGISTHTGVNDVDISSYGDEIEVRVDLSSGDYDPNSEGISAFRSSMEDDAEDYREYKEAIHAILAAGNYVQTTAAHTLKQKMEAGEIEFKNFEITHDNEGYNISLKTEDEEENTGVDFPAQITTHRAAKTVVGPVKYPLAHSVRTAFDDLKTSGGSQRYYVVSSKKLTRQVMDLLTPEINASVKAASQQLKLDLKENTSITPQAVEEILLDGFLLKMREIERPGVSKGWDKHGERKDIIPGRTPVYVNVEELRFILDDDDEYEIIEPIIGFLLYLDKNIDKLFGAITSVLQTIDIQYGNLIKDGQNQINQLVGMATEIIDFTQDVLDKELLSYTGTGSVGDHVLKAKNRAQYVKDKLTGDQAYIDHYLGIQIAGYPLPQTTTFKFNEIVALLMRNHADMNAYWKGYNKEEFTQPQTTHHRSQKPEEEAEKDDAPTEWQPGMPTPLTETLSEKLTRYLGEANPPKSLLFKSKKYKTPVKTYDRVGQDVFSAFEDLKYGVEGDDPTPEQSLALGRLRGYEPTHPDEFVPPERFEPAKGDVKLNQPGYGGLKIKTPEFATFRNRFGGTGLSAAVQYDPKGKKYAGFNLRGTFEENINSEEQTLTDKLKSYLDEQTNSPSKTQQHVKGLSGRLAKSYESGADADRWRRLFKRKKLDPKAGAKVASKIGSQLKGIKATEAPATHDMNPRVADAFYDPKKPKQIQYFKGHAPKKSTVRHEMGHVVSKLASKQKPVSKLVQQDPAAKQIRARKPISRYGAKDVSQRIGTLEPGAMLPSQLYGGKGGEYEQIFRFKYNPKRHRRLAGGLGKIGSRTQALKGYVADELYAPIKNTQWSIQDAAKKDPKKGYMDGHHITAKAVAAICKGEIKVSDKVKSNIRGCFEKDPKKQQQIFKDVSTGLNRVAKVKRAPAPKRMVAESLSEKLTRYLDEIS